jgi:hypothetical protein
VAISSPAQQFSYSTNIPPARDAKQQWQATPEQQRAARDADFLAKFMRPVPSKQLELIDKAILDEVVHAAIWAKEKDEHGAPRVNFRTIALKYGVDERTISRRINERLIYCNLLKIAYQDDSQRWYILVDRGLYEQTARAYHAAYKAAADSGQDIADQGLIEFCAPVKQRGSKPKMCDRCHDPMDKRKVTRVYWYCRRCNKRHKRVVRDTGWMTPAQQVQDEEPAQEPPEPMEEPTRQVVGYTLNHLPPHNALVDLYASLAGEDATHIEMIPTPQKYTSHPDKLSGDQLKAHLDGSHTYGARMWRKDGTTRGFLVDGDSKAAIERLETGAEKLRAAGFLPIREYIPENRPRYSPDDEETFALKEFHPESRRFALVIDALVDARAGWQEIYRIAPEWEGLEHWPMVSATPRGNRTRLPGGMYRMPGFSGWCELYSLSDCESSSNGLEAAELLYSHQSSAALIPPYSAIAPPEVESSEQEETAPLSESGNEQLLAAQSDNPHFLIAFAPAELAARFNSEHDLADFLEPGARGRFFSPNGCERTASAALYCKDGRELVTDFSTHGARPDGTHDTGDALEVYCKQARRSKRDVLSELGKVVYREAKSAIEAAARDRAALPGWIEARITESGRALYAHLLGGVTGSESGGGVDTPAPRAVPSVVPQAQWMIATPCERCALPFQLKYSGPHSEAPVCPRCPSSPPKGGYPREWDMLYPKKRPRAAAFGLIAAVLP